MTKAVQHANNQYVAFRPKDHDPQAIYNQYVTYWNQIAKDIHDIDSLPDPSKPNIVLDRTTILAAEQDLTTTYQADYADPSKSLDGFINDCKPTMDKVTEAYNDAMGLSPIQQEIQDISNQATTLSQTLSTHIAQDQTLVSGSAFDAEVTQLQQQIAALPVGEKRTKAQNDLNDAEARLAQFKQAAAPVQAALTVLTNRLGGITQPQSGVLAQLQALASKTNPTQDDLNQANTLLGVVTALQTDLGTYESGPLAPVQQSGTAVANALFTVQTDLQPSPPPPPVIEHSCWYLDWTSWDFSRVPQGVNVVNIFVGKLDYVDGHWVLDGFGNADMTKLRAFIKACNAKGIQLMASVGGGGGSYDNTWDLITDTNAQIMGQDLAAWCMENGLSGIDFDFEENTGNVPLQLRVGRVILAFKQANPSLQAALCTNAGFGPNYPWLAQTQNIMDAAVDPQTKKCAVDRLRGMFYYNDLESEKGWATGWANWAKERYGYTPAQLAFGIDDFDAHAYDIGEASKWAASQGFSTGYWAWNPATPDDSDKSTLKILNNYTTAPSASFSAILKSILNAFSWIIDLACLLFSIRANLDLQQPAAATASKRPHRRRALITRPPAFAPSAS